MPINLDDIEWDPEPSPQQPHKAAPNAVAPNAVAPDVSAPSVGAPNVNTPNPDDIEWGSSSEGPERASLGDWLINQGLGFATGIGEAVPLGQDVPSAIAATLPDWAAPKYVQGKDSWLDRFEAAKRAQIQAAKEMGTTAPKAQLAGNITGLVGSVAPIGRVAAPVEAAVSSKLAPIVGETAGTAAGMGVSGAGVGAIQGAGEGVTGEERIRNAKTGTIVGGGLGATLPVIGSGIKAATKPFRPSDTKASEIIGSKLSTDVARGHEVLSQAEIDAARARGQEILPIDVGGKALHEEARRAANISDEASSTLSSKLGPRYADQQRRYGDFIKELAGGKDLNAAGVIEKMRADAKEINRPAYEAAYKAGESGVWTPELYNLTNTPSIKKAIPEAVEKLQERSILEGKGPVDNPFVKDESGNYFLPSGYKPSLEFWDGIKRSLDDKIGAFDRAGEYDKSRSIKAVREKLLEHLDSAVPEFKVARAGAAKAFGEDDAFAAGMTYLGKKSTLTSSDAAKAVSKMTPEEKELFASGVLHDVAQRVKNVSESRNIPGLFDAPAMREKLVVALGKDKAAELEAFARVESLMTRSYRAVSGNSTTAQQAARAGIGPSVKELANISGRAVMPALGWATGGPWGAAAGAVADAIVTSLAGVMQRKTAVAIAEKLVSGNPEDVRAAVATIAKSTPAMSRLRYITRAAGQAGANAASKKVEGSVDFMSDDRRSRAAGGKIDSKDYPAKRLTRMERAAKRAREALALEARPLMTMNDEDIANALRIASKQ